MSLPVNVSGFDRSNSEDEGAMIVPWAANKGRNAPPTWPPAPVNKIRIRFVRTTAGS